MGDKARWFVLVEVGWERWLPVGSGKASLRWPHSAKAGSSTCRWDWKSGVGVSGHGDVHKGQDQVR